MTKKKEVLKNLLLILCGAIAAWLVFSHMGHFRSQDWVYQANPGMKKYVGANIVSPWADFSFFTYITMLLFAAWSNLLGLSGLFGLKKLNNFLLADWLVSFIFVNYLLTVVLYTVFELTMATDKFGFYANVPLAWHNLATNILNHYVLFACELVIFIKIKPNKSKLSLMQKLSIMLAFLCVYFVAVKLTGEFAYNIKWFPYPIFDAATFGGLLGIKSYAWCVVLLVAVDLIIAVSFCLMYALFLKLKEKASAQTNEDQKELSLN